MKTASRILCETVRDTLRDNVPLRDEICDNRVNGLPPANSGQNYVAVFPTTMSDGPSPDQSHGHDELLGFGIGITQRVGYCPDDRMYREAAEKEDNPRGILVIQERIRRIIRVERFNIVCNASNALEGLSEGGTLLEPPTLKSTTLTVRVVGPAHFKAKPVKDMANCADVGLYVEILYGGVRYMEATLSGINWMTIEDDFIVA